MLTEWILIITLTVLLTFIIYRRYLLAKYRLKLCMENGAIQKIDGQKIIFHEDLGFSDRRKIIVEKILVDKAPSFYKQFDRLIEHHKNSTEADDPEK
jgi:hypothetical protein